MTSNAIAIYSLKFKEGKNIKNPVEMYELINDCFRWKDGSTERDEESSRLFRINLKICNPHEIGGIIEAGRFGTGNPIVNVDSGKEEYHKNPRQSDLNPHYFLFLSRGSTRNSGYFVSERIRNDGVEGLLLNVIRKCLGGIIPIHESVMTREMIKQKLEQLKEIRLVKHVPSKDLSDAIREDTQDEGLYFEYRIRAERKKLLPPIFSRHILEFLENPDKKGIFTLSEVVAQSGSDEKKKWEEIRPHDFEFILTDVQLGHTKRTIKMERNDASMRPYFQLPEDIPLDNNRWPLYDEIDKFAKGIIKDVSSEVAPST